MPDLIPLTEADFRRFAPDAKRQYVDTLMANLAELDSAGIRESNLRLCHFLAQCHAETGGFTILRESLNYKTVAAIRKAWTARASKHTDDWIARHLLGKPVDLGDWAYGGRMGNRKGTTDGYDYRGGGWIQTTGREAVQKYCKLCGIEIRPDILDDYESTLKFAAAEWKSANCNKWADQNNILALSKVINVGNANSSIVPNGMPNRKSAFAKAWEIWGEAKPEPKPVVRTKDLVTVSRKAKWLVWVERVFHSIWGLFAIDKALSALDIAQDVTGKVKAFVTEEAHVLAITGAILGALAVKYVISLMREDVEEGRATPSGEVEAT